MKLDSNENFSMREKQCNFYQKRRDHSVAIQEKNLHDASILKTNQWT